MYTLFFSYLLLSQTALGLICAPLLFVFCFSLVHLARLVKFGWRYQAQNQAKPDDTATQKSKDPPVTAPKQEPPAPVYYIVERKRKSKTSYGEPKQIRFK